MVNPFRAGWFPLGLTSGFQVLVTFSVASPFGLVLVWVTSAIPASQGFGWRQVSGFGGISSA
jgi:hypothetical protein